MRRPSWLRAMTTAVGSERGKDRLEIVVRVEQGGRAEGVPFSDSETARSVGGQVRFVPAFTERVRPPQVPQKALRAFQSKVERAWA